MTEQDSKRSDATTTPAVETVVDDRPWTERHRHALVIGSRTALLMLLIAGLVMLGLGLLSFFLTDPPEVNGWLRSIFGTVFGVVASAMAAIIGIPAAVGLWAMSGATSIDARPALSLLVRRSLVVVAMATLLTTVVVVATTGSSFAILNVGLVALTGLALLGLAGASAFSPHGARATLSGVAVVLVATGALWVLARAFL